MPEKLRKKSKVLRKKKRQPWRKDSWVSVGLDISTSSIAGAAFGWDATLRLFKGPSFFMQRWSKDDHYFKRMKDASYASDCVLDLAHQLGIMNASEDTYIAIEEPWSFGHIGKGNSNSLKQQAEINGSFIGGLLRYGYSNIWQIHNTWWRQLVAEALGITIHHTKWNPNGEGKFRAKQWALEIAEFEVPEWPDLITSKGGLIPRPEGSKAKAKQSDDRYEALAMAKWMELEVRRNYIG